MHRKLPRHGSTKSASSAPKINRTPNEKVDLRKSLVAVLAVLSLALTGCAAPSDYASLKPVCGSASDSSTVDKVQAVGNFGTKPTVTFPAPLSSKTIVSHVISAGTGPKFVGNQIIKFNYVALNAATGKAFSSTKYDGTDAVIQSFGPSQQINFCKALAGVPEGSRVAVLIPAKMAHGNQGDSTAGLGANDDVIFVMDLVKVYYPRAIGQIQPQVDGAPTIIRTVSGQPSVQIPGRPAPTKLELFNTITSSNPQTVSLGDTVTLQYSGFLWKGGTQFDSSWSNAPVQWKLTETGFIKGFVKALTESRNGKAPHVGDEIMAIIPPGDGYGATAQGAIPANSTLVFVIDILGTESTK
jgi:FKBP-type peptidyl-prolyl cis-trans isomerase